MNRLQPEKRARRLASSRSRRRPARSNVAAPAASGRGLKVALFVGLGHRLASASSPGSPPRSCAAGGEVAELLEEADAAAEEAAEERRRRARRGVRGADPGHVSQRAGRRRVVADPSRPRRARPVRAGQAGRGGAARARPRARRQARLERGAVRAVPGRARGDRARRRPSPTAIPDGGATGSGTRSRRGTASASRRSPSAPARTPSSATSRSRTLDPGDEVVTGWPSFPSYVLDPLKLGAVPVRVPLRDDRLDLDAILDAVTRADEARLHRDAEQPDGDDDHAGRARRVLRARAAARAHGRRPGVLRVHRRARLPGRDRGVREGRAPRARPAHVLEDLRPRRASGRLRRSARRRSSRRSARCAGRSTSRPPARRPRSPASTRRRELERRRLVEPRVDDASCGARFERAGSDPPARRSRTSCSSRRRRGGGRRRAAPARRGRASDGPVRRAGRAPHHRGHAGRDRLPGEARPQALRR